MTQLVWLGLIVFLGACEGHGRWRPQVSNEAP